MHVDILVSAACVAAFSAIADDAILGDDIVVVAGALFFAEGECIVEEDESSTCLQALFNWVHHSCREERRKFANSLTCDESDICITELAV